MKIKKLINIKKYLRILFLSIICLQCITLFAQDELEDKVDTTNAKTYSKEKSQIVKLKKSYFIGDGISFRSANGSLTISPTLQTLFEAASTSNNLSSMSTGFSVSRARVTVAANLFDKKINVIARLNLPSTNNSITTGNRAFNTTLQEAYLEYRPNIKHIFNIGLRADYIDTRELRCQGENLGFITRSGVSEAFDAIFDYGIRYKGNYKLGGKHLLRPYFSITTGDSRSSLQRNFGGFRYGMRLDYLPFDKFSQGGEYYWDDIFREPKPKLVVGVVYNYNDGASSAVGTNGGRWLYGDAKQKIILPTNTRWIVDYLFKYQGFYSLGSYVTSSANVPNNITGEFRLDGTFTPYSPSQTIDQTNNRVRSRLNLGSGYNVQAGYIFSNDISIGFRYATVSREDNAAAFANYDKFYTTVISKYLYKHDLKLQAEFGFNQLQEALQTPTSKGMYYAQLLATIQL
jgi:phosphate-selective porin OprO and OprP